MFPVHLSVRFLEVKNLMPTPPCLAADHKLVLLLAKCSWGRAVSILVVSPQPGGKSRQKSATRFAMTQSAQLTRVIRAINEGDPKAASEVLPLVYTDVSHLA